MKKYFLITAIITIVLAACTIQKRQYLPGYYVHWREHAKEMTTAKKNNELMTGMASADQMQNKKNDLKEYPIQEEVHNTFVQKENKIYFQKQTNELENEKMTTHEFKSQRNSLNDESSVNDRTENRNGDGWLYLIAGLMGLSVLGAIKSRKRTVRKITKWAKTNPKRTRRLIAGLQFSLVGLGVLSGYNLRMLGFEFSNHINYIFGSITFLGFLSVPFLHKKNSIPLPKQIHKQKLAFLGVTLSALMMSVGFGNNVQRYLPNFALTHAIENVDHSIFRSGNAEQTISSPHVEKNLEQNERIAMTGMSLGGAIILIFLLCLLFCAGVCIAGFGVFAIAQGDPASIGLGVLGLFAGIGIATLAVKGINSVSKNYRETRDGKS